MLNLGPMSKFLNRLKPYWYIPTHKQDLNTVVTSPTQASELLTINFICELLRIIKKARWLFLRLFLVYP